MKYLFIFVVILFACSDEPEKKCTPFEVIISDALPIQFWQADCDTYNEKEVCGVHAKCWCQPWNCDDEIPLQFTDETVDLEFSLNIIDESESVLQNLPFSKSEVYLTDTDFEFTNGGFTSTILNWDQYSGSPGSSAGWSWNAIGPFGCAVADGTSGTLADTYELYQERLTTGIGGYYKYPPGTYTIEINVSNGSSGGSSPLQEGFIIKGFDTPGGTSESSSALNIVRGGGFTTYTHSITTTQPWNYLGIQFYKQGVSAGSAIQIYLNSISITEYPVDYSTTVYDMAFTPNDYDICNERVRLTIVNDTASPDADVAKSDCLDIKQAHACTNIIEYFNNLNLDGLIYEDVSPVTTFRIRVPSVFFHEKFIEEDNVIKLTSSIVKTSSSIEAQRLFETDYMPYYMHRKLQLIFKHQDITIDSKNWVKREAYEIQEGERRWPLKKAKCYLNEDNYVRSVL